MQALGAAAPKRSRRGSARMTPIKTAKPVTTRAEKQLFQQLLAQYVKENGAAKWDDFAAAFNTNVQEQVAGSSEATAGQDDMLYPKTAEHMRQYHIMSMDVLHLNGVLHQQAALGQVVNQAAAAAVAATIDNGFDLDNFMEACEGVMHQQQPMHNGAYGGSYSGSMQLQPSMHGTFAWGSGGASSSRSRGTQAAAARAAAIHRLPLKRQLAGRQMGQAVLNPVHVAASGMAGIHMLAASAPLDEGGYCKGR